MPCMQGNKEDVIMRIMTMFLVPRVALSPMSLDWVLNTKTGKVVFTCPQCDQPVSVEGSWASLVRQYTNSTDDKPNKIS